MISIITAPTVSYKCKLRGQKDEIKVVDNPLEAPLPENID
jgi:translation elongation factor EF-4